MRGGLLKGAPARAVDLAQVGVCEGGPEAGTPAAHPEPAPDQLADEITRLHVLVVQRNSAGGAPATLRLCDGLFRIGRVRRPHLPHEGTMFSAERPRNPPPSDFPALFSALKPAECRVRARRAEYPTCRHPCSHPTCSRTRSSSSPAGVRGAAPRGRDASPRSDRTARGA